MGTINGIQELGGVCVHTGELDQLYSLFQLFNTVGTILKYSDI